MVDIQFLSKIPIKGHGTTQMRCVQPSEYLRASGWSVSVGCVYRNLPQAKKILILHRCVADSMTMRAIKLARLQGCKLLYDVDDLIFSSEGNSHLASASGRNGVEKDWSAGYREVMKLCDLVICSTSYLRDKAVEINSNCVVIKNGLSRQVVSIAEQICMKSVEKSDKEKVGLTTIGYFSGSDYHDDDFNIVENVLLNLLRNRNDIRVILGGKLKFSKEFFKFGEKFRYFEFLPYHDFFKILVEIDINLVPLVIESPFSQARSELKFLEAGILGIPSFCSKTNTYKECIDSGVNGVLCSENEWSRKLLEYVGRHEEILRLGNAARKTVMNGYGDRPKIVEWGRLISKVSRGHPDGKSQVSIFSFCRSHWLITIQYGYIFFRFLKRSFSRG